MKPVNLNHLRAHVEILRFVKRKKAELKELEANSRSEIEQAMGESDTGELDGKPAINWQRYKRRQLDQKALEENLPEVHEAYMKTSEVRRFVVLDEESGEE